MLQIQMMFLRVMEKSFALSFREPAFSEKENQLEDYN
jgi:hypothetical protein